jgi:hypothetical protein
MSPVTCHYQHSSLKIILSLLIFTKSGEKNQIVTEVLRIITHSSLMDFTSSTTRSSSGLLELSISSDSAGGESSSSGFSADIIGSGASGTSIDSMAGADGCSSSILFRFSSSPIVASGEIGTSDSPLRIFSISGSGTEVPVGI